MRYRRPWYAIIAIVGLLSVSTPPSRLNRSQISNVVKADLDCDLPSTRFCTEDGMIADDARAAVEEEALTLPRTRS